MKYNNEGTEAAKEIFGDVGNLEKYVKKSRFYL